MASESVTPIRRRARAVRRATSRPLILTEIDQETPHRVACVLRYLASRESREGAGEDSDDVEFGRYIVLHDLATALDNISWPVAVDVGAEVRS